MTYRILVTGIGGVVGYGVLRSLREHDPSLHLIGCDMYEFAVGREWADKFHLAPAAASSGWADWLQATAQQTDVDLIIATLDPELDQFARNPAIETQLLTRVALPGHRTLAVAQDKWLLDQALQGDPARITSSLSPDYEHLVQKLGSPFIVKPRAGYGSRGVTLVRSQAEFSRFQSRLPDEFFAQELVGDEDHEYTVGVIGDGEGEVLASITLQRWLSAEGMTMRARTVAPIAAIDSAVARLTRLFQPRGAVNLQFRLEQGEARLLEVNARVSSSTSIRTAFGYNEAGMLVDLLLRDEPPTQPVIRMGEAVRFVEDVVRFQ